MNTTTAVLPTYLDGPRLVEWIEEEEGGHIDNASDRLGYHDRLIRDWREGVPASVASADIVLTKLNLHLGHVPEDYYVEHETSREKTPEQREEMVRLVLEEGMTPPKAAREIGCDPQTVRRYVEKAKRERELQLAA